MTKSCQKCGSKVADDAKFCPNCGFDFRSSGNANASDGKFDFHMLFVILIISSLIIGSILILTVDWGDAKVSNTPDDVDHVDLTITEVMGYDGGDSSSSYTLYTLALFNKVPSDLKGYNVKTTYYDKNNTEIGSEIESLAHVYYDSDYALTLGYYTTYKKPDPKYVTVEIIKDGKTIDNYTSQIDQGKIKFLTNYGNRKKDML